MAITSIGYGGTVDYPDYGKGVVSGSRYSLDGAGDLRPTRVTSGADRTVRVAAGTAQGYGIRDTLDEAVDYQLPTVSSGHQWFEVVLRRDWSSNETTLTHIAGSTGGPLLPTRQKNPGVLDDQPICLVQITAGQQYPTDLIDLRCWAGDGGVVAVDTRALTYLDIPGSRVSIGGDMYTCVLSPAGAASWDVKREPETGIITPAQPSLWSRNLRWSKSGRNVTLEARPVRNVGAGDLTQPGSGSRLYNLPSHLRPETDRYTVALSPRIADGAAHKYRGLFSVYVFADGGVFVYNTDPDWPIGETTSYHFNITYWTAN